MGLTKALAITNFMLIQALIMASLAFGRDLEVIEAERIEITEGIRLDMKHVDSLMDPNTLHSPERLRIAAEKSIHRARVLARRAKPTYSSFSSSSSSQEEEEEEEEDSAPVYSSDNGAYLVDLALGTPPQSFNGVLDTGSDLVWRQSSPCQLCFPEADPLFNPSNSSTYKTLSCTDALCEALTPFCQGSQCEYQYSYGDGSTTSGVLSSDTLTIGGSSVNSFAFGAGLLNYGNIGSVGTDGIIGMGGGPLSLTSQMSSVIDDKFSYCLVSWTDAPSQTSPLFLGSNATLTGKGVKSTPILTSASIPTFYYLNLTGISFNGKLLDIPPGTFDLQSDGSGGVLIDSGTTVTILVDAGYSPIKSSYSSTIKLPPKDGSSVGLDLCYDNSGNATVNILPLTFHFDGADVELPPENIFFDYEGYFCLAFLPMPSQMNLNIYGNQQQQNFEFLYDRGSVNKLSFKPTNCQSL